MKRVLTGLVAIVLFFFLLVSGCSDNNNANDAGNNSDSASEVKCTARYQYPSQEQRITVTGKGNDSILIYFPQNALDISNDTVQGMDLHVTLDYENGRLKGISFDEDLRFNTGVTVTFNVESLSDNLRFLVYVGDETYNIPFVKNGNTYTYTLEHFSNYEFREAGASGDRAAEITSALNDLENAADKSEGVVPHINEINNLLALIAILEVQGHDQADEYMDRAGRVMAAYAKAFISAVTDPGEYINGYCMAGGLKKKIQELIKNWAVLEQTAPDAPEYDQAGQKLVEWISNLVNAFTAKSLESACENIFEYLICGSNIAAQAELAGLDSKSQTVLAKIQSEFSGKVTEIISEQVNTGLTNCDEIMDCLAIALQAAGQFNMTADVSRLATRLDDVENQCRRSECPYAWDVTATIDSRYESGFTFNHSATFKDLLIVTTEDEWDAADINDQCSGLSMADKEHSIYNDQDSSILNFSGTFYHHNDWNGTMMPGIYLEKDDQTAEEATFSENIIPYVRNGAAFSLTTTRQAEGGGTITATIDFTPHVPH